MKTEITKFTKALNMVKRYPTYKVAGFSLPDLLVAMLITGILLSLVIPSRQKLVSKAKSMQAKILLSDLKTSQESYFYENSSYSNDISLLDMIVPTTIENGGASEYSLSIVEASGQGYTARATALKDFDGDGTFDTWEVTQSGKIINIVAD